MEMTWKGIGGLFPDEPEPFWTDPHLGTHSDRLMWLLDGLGSRRWGALAAERLRAETAVLDPAEWARMDLVLRERLAGYSGIHAPRWARGPDDVRRMVLPAGTEAAVMGVLSTHPDGYVRQAAVERLALLGDGGELPPLLLRANDWVPQVRAPAHEALRTRVVEAYVPHWVRSLALVLRLRGCGRGNYERLVEGVLALLRTPAARDEVRAGLSSPDTSVRRACLRILLDAEGAGLDALIGDALGSGDGMLRLLAAQAATRLDEPALRVLLPRIMQDGFARVRLVALRLGASRPGVVLPALRPALLDRSPAVRGEARAALARLEPLDFAAFYRGHVAADGPRLPAAVAGLAETGGQEDSDLLAPLLATRGPGCAPPPSWRWRGSPATTPSPRWCVPWAMRAARCRTRPRWRCGRAPPGPTWGRGSWGRTPRTCGATRCRCWRGAASGTRSPGFSTPAPMRSRRSARPASATSGAGRPGSTARSRSPPPASGSASAPRWNGMISTWSRGTGSGCGSPPASPRTRPATRADPGESPRRVAIERFF